MGVGLFTNNCFREGREAFKDGQTKADCPYFPTDETDWASAANRWDWLLGYEDARETAAYVDKLEESERD